MNILDASPNPFRGMVINPQTLPESPEMFRRQLADSLNTWEKDACLLAWLEVPLERAALIPVAVEAGFIFHHSKEDYLLLVRRINPDAFIPGYATHYIGAGGVVLNDKQELLVVSEQHRRNRDRPYWKLPGGALHPGEHLAEGAIREVLEETGVQTRFEGLVCFRHWHSYRYGKSDIYFVCRLSPLSAEITKQDDEIEACLWMPVDQYLTNEYVGDFNRRIVQAALSGPYLVTDWVDGYDDTTLREFFMPPSRSKE